MFNGQGSNIVSNNIAAGVLKVENCVNVVVKNLNIDYDPLPYAFGTITYVSGNIFHMKVDEGYIGYNDPNFKFSAQRGASWGIKITYDQNGETVYGQSVVESITFEHFAI